MLALVGIFSSQFCPGLAYPGAGLWQWLTSSCIQYLESDLMRGQNSTRLRNGRITGYKIVMRPVGCFATENFLEEIAWNKRQHSWEVAIILGLQVCMAVPVYVTCMLTKELGRKKKKKGQHPQSSLALHQDFCPPDFFHYNGRLLNKHDEHSCLVHKSPLYPEKEAIIKV